MVERFAAIIPAHNEEAEILGCLDSVLASLARTPETIDHRDYRVLIVADACTDHTQSLAEKVAADHPCIDVLTTTFKNVGKARNTAGHHFLTACQPQSRESLHGTWIAFTDADSRVPEQWVASHLEAARSGVDCLVGTVEPRPATGSERLTSKWHDMHKLCEDHPHIFGANLGIRGSYFDAISGIPPLECGEDVAVVNAVLKAGGEVKRTDMCRVLTSARLEGRVPSGGFSDYLKTLI